MRHKSQLNRILIVDDEPNVRLVFRTALESVGYTVAEAEDGASALEYLAGSPADRRLARSPDAGHWRYGGAPRRLRDSGNDVPVVIVTAHGSIPDAVQAMKLGADRFPHQAAESRAAPPGRRRGDPPARRTGRGTERNGSPDSRQVAGRASSPTVVMRRTRPCRPHRDQAGLEPARVRPGP